MNEIAGACQRREFAVLSPADLAPSREHKGNRLLASVMVHAGPRAWLDFEKAAPQCRRDANFRRDCGGALRARRLRRSGIELIGTDDSDRVAVAHDADLSSLRLQYGLAEP